MICRVRRQAKRQPRNILNNFLVLLAMKIFDVKLKSKSLSVEVIELPLENKPTEFSGAVGDFSYKVELDKNQVKANDAINLKVIKNKEILN